MPNSETQNSQPQTANNPTYYSSLSPEPITVIEGWSLAFHLGNVIKYLARAGRKPGACEIRDLRKAHWYLQRWIDIREAELTGGTSPPPHGQA